MTETAADRALAVVWGAMAASILVYGMVAILVIRSGRPQSASSGVDLWLEIEAAGTAWAALVLWKTRRNDPICSGALDQESPDGRAAIRKVSIVCCALALQLLLAPGIPSRTEIR